MINRRLELTVIASFFICLTLSAEDQLRIRNDAIIVRAIERMPEFDYSKDAHVQQAIARHLARAAGTEAYVALAKKFSPDDMPERLQELLTSDVSASVKVEAANMLLRTEEGPKRLATQLRSESLDEARQAAAALSNLGNERSKRLLVAVAGEEKIPFDVRRVAVAGLAKTADGQKSILDLAQSKRLAADTRLLAGGLLARSDDKAIRLTASKLLPQPQQKDAKPVAPIDELSAMRGSVANGLKLFRGVATCANCHVIDKFGKEVGPDLSEIGSKLSREAMFTSILDPSAGISHNYENYSVLTSSGQVISGLLVSEKPNEVIIRTAEAIDRKIAQADIEQMKKSDKSIMPDNLHQTMDQSGLVDVVEYMISLKKK